MAQCTDLPCVIGGKAIRNARGNPIVSQEKHVVPAQWGYSSHCTSGPKTSHLHLQRSLGWTGRDIKALIYKSPVDSEEDHIALLLRQ
jgi:hypothetical protein